MENRLFQSTLDELDAAREWMLLLGRKTAQEKVASFLLMLARKSSLLGCGGTEAMTFSLFVLPMTRSDMADYLGLTIETVSRQITHLKSRKIISVTGNREFLVPDMKVLIEAAGEDQPVVD